MTEASASIGLLLATALVMEFLADIEYLTIIIQQIVTLSKYGHDALDICHP